MIYRVLHRSEYEYANAVDLASHLLHLRPRPLPHQRVLSTRVTADPAPARQSIVTPRSVARPRTISSTSSHSWFRSVGSTAGSRSFE